MKDLVRRPGKGAEIKKAAAVLAAFLFCIFFSFTIKASERLSDFSDLLQSIDAEAKPPENKKKISGNEVKDRSLKRGSGSAGEDKRLKGFAELAGEADDGEDERLKEFALLAKKSSGSAVEDERLTEFAKAAGKREAEYERKYGAVIEDNVISDPGKYNDGDRVTVTAGHSVFVGKGTAFLRTSTEAPEEDSERKSVRSEAAGRFLNKLFSGEIGRQVFEKTDERNKEDVLYHDRIGLGIFTLTAYDACIECCGKTDGITATGTRAEKGRTIAVDPMIIPYGSRVMINGHVYTAEDTGSKIKGNVIDIFMNTHEEAKQFGRRSAEVFLLR